MATFLDISILGHFTSIFTFLLIFVVVFALLEVFNAFGEGRRGIHAIIAMCVGFIVIFSTGVVAVIQTFTPWFTVLILLLFFILFLVRMFGLGDAEIKAGFFNNPSIMTWILIFTIIIILFSLGSGFGQTSLEQGTGTGNSTGTPVVNGTGVAPAGSTATSSFNQNLFNTLFHPKVLGMFLIMLIVVIAMLLLTTREGP